MGRAAVRAGLALAVAGSILWSAWQAMPGGTGRRDGPEPFVPAAGDRSVLERLPGGARESALARARREAPAGASGAADGELLERARRHLDAARTSGDPREAGRARAALSRWEGRADAPAPVLRVRAAVAQHLHAFDEALADLDAVIAREPADLQALWLRASVRRVVGRLSDADADCVAVDLATGGRTAAAAACIADLARLRGERDAAQRLDARLAAARVPDAERGWIEVVRAEIARHDGRDADAERALRAALAAGPPSPYARVALADLLIDAGRAAEVDAVLRDAAPTDAVLLRRAIALRAVGSDATALADALRARFEAAVRRGDAAPHLREHARFALDVEGEPQRAVELAERNWRIQKEPADAVLLVRAARAAGRPQAAGPVRAFVAAGALDPAVWGEP